MSQSSSTINLPPAYHSNTFLPFFPPYQDEIEYLLNHLGLDRHHNPSVPDDDHESYDEPDYFQHTPRIIFPRLRSPAHAIPRVHHPNLVNPWPLGFAMFDQWRTIWESDEIKLDPYLRYYRSGQHFIPVPWNHKSSFSGTPYRLTICNQKNLDGLPLLMHGMIVSFQDCNNHRFRYIIDHCAFADEQNAYLKVVCYDVQHIAYDALFCRPPFILVVPLNHCNPKIRIHPLLSHKSNHSSNICTPFWKKPWLFLTRFFYKKSVIM